MATEKRKRSKGLTRALLLGVLCLIVGGIMYLTGMSAIDWEYYKLDPNTYTEQVLDLSSKAFEGQVPTAYKLSVEDYDIKVQNGEEFSFKYYVTENTIESHSFENGVFSFSSHESYKFFQHGFFASFAANSYNGAANYRHGYVLTVPSDLTLNLELKNSNLLIDGEFNDVNLKLDNGHVTVDGNYNRLSVWLKNGHLKLDGVARDVAVDVDNGNIATAKFSVEREFSLKHVNGNSSFVGLHTPILKATIDNSRLVLSNSSVSSLLDLTGNDGKLTLIDAERMQDIRLNTDNFSVIGGKVQADSLVAIMKNGKMQFDYDIKNAEINAKNMTFKLTASEASFKQITVSGNNSKLKAYRNGAKCHDNQKYLGNGDNTLTINGNDNSVRVDMRVG